MERLVSKCAHSVQHSSVFMCRWVLAEGWDSSLRQIAWALQSSNMFVRLKLESHSLKIIEVLYHRYGDSKTARWSAYSSVSSIKCLSEVETVQSHACFQPVGSLAFNILSIHAVKPARQVLTVGAEEYFFIWVPPAFEKHTDSGKASLSLDEEIQVCPWTLPSTGMQ